MYNYAKTKSEIFTEEGLAMFTKIRDRAKHLLKEGGAFTMEAVIKGTCGDSWVMLACVDHMVEKGEIREVTAPGKVAGQHRVFVAA